MAGTFLADRFVKGTCPNAASRPTSTATAARSAATHYNPAELIDPVSTLSGAKPEIRTASHLFVNIERLHGFLDRMGTQSGALQPEMANYLKGHFLGEPLHDWDVSRPAPYFGFEIPDSPGNYWYVWFDAPIGYMGSTRQWCERHGEQFDDWWRSRPTEIHHFIGKDITYFHTLFWPAMLQTAGFSLPTKVHIHGFLTVDGEKMSKIEGHVHPRADVPGAPRPGLLALLLRLEARPRGVDDLDLNLDEFVAKVNADMVGKVVNLASRTARFAEPTGLAAAYPDDGGLFQQAAADGEAIAEAYEAGDFARAMRLVLAASRAGQQVRRGQRPWNLRGPDAGASGCRTSARSAEPVPPVGRLPGPRAAAAGRADRQACWTIRSRAGTNRSSRCWARRSAASST